MRYLKTYETFRISPLSDEEINKVFDELSIKLKILGLKIDLKKQQYGRLDIDEPKSRFILDVSSDFSEIENSILNLIVHKIVKEPFNHAAMLYNNNLEITILNEFEGEHADNLIKSNNFYINSQTPEFLYKNIIEKMILKYQEIGNKLKVTATRLINSATNNIYSNTNLKQIILDYLNSLLYNSTIPEYIFQEVVDSIQYTTSPHKTTYFLNKTEPFTFIYKNIEKYLNDDLKKSSTMGEMGFGD